MYIYNVSQYEPYSLDLFLVHEKKFTQEETESTVKEVIECYDCIYAKTVDIK